MRISDWSSDVCSSDLGHAASEASRGGKGYALDGFRVEMADHFDDDTPVVSRSKFAVELGETVGKAGDHDAATYRQHGALMKFVVIVRQSQLMGYRQFSARSDERRVGNGGVSTCRFRWSPYT